MAAVGTSADTVRTDAVSSSDDGSVLLGYEAAHPALQARHWPDLSN